MFNAFGDRTNEILEAIDKSHGIIMGKFKEMEIKMQDMNGNVGIVGVDKDAIYSSVFRQVAQEIHEKVKSTGAWDDCKQEFPVEINGSIVMEKDLVPELGHYEITAAAIHGHVSLSMVDKGRRFAHLAMALIQILDYAEACDVDMFKEIRKNLPTIEVIDYT